MSHATDTTDYSKLTKTWKEDVEFHEISQSLAPIVEADTEMLPARVRKEMHANAQSAWDAFFTLQPAGYQDRKYIDREWTHFKADQLGSWKKRQESGGSELVTVLEVGCGVGNLLFPLAELRPDFTFIGIDISGVAVQKLEEKAESLDMSVATAVVDLSTTPIPPSILPAGGVDAATMIFTLSALDPLHHRDAMKRVFDAMAHESLLFFRDHGQYDIVQVKHAKKGGNRLADRLYVRDGNRTFAYYFAKEEVEALMTEVGFNVVECDYVVREQYNRKKRIKWTHVWITGHFIRP